MNELLQKHGCSNVFRVPEGLKELMADITREVLREQPTNLCDFIANYLSALLITREHGVLTVKILDDLCDCKPSILERLLLIEIEKDDAEKIADIIKEAVEGGSTPAKGAEKVREAEILKEILTNTSLDEHKTTKVCQIARNAYRDYWYRKSFLEQQMKSEPQETWQKAAQHTLEIYKKTKPSFCELSRAAQKIQVAYKGYYVRRNVLKHLKSPKIGAKKEMPGPPLDTAAEREIDLGKCLEMKIKMTDNIDAMFDEHDMEQLGVKYHAGKTITMDDDETFQARSTRLESRMIESKSYIPPPTSDYEAVPPDYPEPSKDLMSIADAISELAKQSKTLNTSENVTKIPIATVQKSESMTKPTKSISITEGPDVAPSKSKTISMSEGVDAAHSRSKTISMSEVVDVAPSRSKTISMSEAVDAAPSRSKTISMSEGVGKPTKSISISEGVEGGPMKVRSKTISISDTASSPDGREHKSKLGFVTQHVKVSLGRQMNAPMPTPLDSFCVPTPELAEIPEDIKDEQSAATASVPSSGADIAEDTDLDNEGIIDEEECLLIPDL